MPDLHGLADFQVPSSGFSAPVIMRNSVVLPAPFGPMMPTMMPPRRHEIEILDEQVVAVALLQVPRLDNDVAEPWARGDVDFSALNFLRGVLAQQFFVRVQSGLPLGLARTRRHADPFELALEGPLTPGFRLFLLRQPPLLLFEP